MNHLLAGTEGLIVEVLIELHGHLVGVVRIAVYILLLQKVDLHCHAAYTLLGLVKRVICHCR